MIFFVRFLEGGGRFKNQEFVNVKKSISSASQKVIITIQQLRHRTWIFFLLHFFTHVSPNNDVG